MARCGHLPIDRAAFNLAVHVQKIVHNFRRYHKYTLGTEPREGSRRILARIIEAMRWSVQSSRAQGRAHSCSRTAGREDPSAYAVANGFRTTTPR